MNQRAALTEHIQTSKTIQKSRWDGLSWSFTS